MGFIYWILITTVYGMIQYNWGKKKGIQFGLDYGFKVWRRGKKNAKQEQFDKILYAVIQEEEKDDADLNNGVG